VRSAVVFGVCCSARCFPAVELSEAKSTNLADGPAADGRLRVVFGGFGAHSIDWSGGGDVTRVLLTRWLSADDLVRCAPVCRAWQRETIAKDFVGQSVNSGRDATGSAAAVELHPLFQRATRRSSQVDGTLILESTGAVAIVTNAQLRSSE
jgi:hypothetical protein